jgi:hypothetical protein
MQFKHSRLATVDFPLDPAITVQQNIKLCVTLSLQSR